MNIEHCMLVVVDVTCAIKCSWHDMGVGLWVIHFGNQVTCASCYFKATILFRISYHCTETSATLVMDFQLGIFAGVMVNLCQVICMHYLSFTV
jgi:hypothetical protein